MNYYTKGQWVHLRDRMTGKPKGDPIFVVRTRMRPDPGSNRGRTRLQIVTVRRGTEEWQTYNTWLAPLGESIT